MSELEQQPTIQEAIQSTVRSTNGSDAAHPADKSAVDGGIGERADTGLSSGLNAAALAGTDFDFDQKLDESFEYRYGFRVGPLRLMHDGSAVVELVDAQKPTRLPNVPAFLQGVVNVRGNLIPLYDLRVLLAEEFSAAQDASAPAKSEKSFYAVFGSGQRSAMLAIDQLPAQVRFTQDMIVNETDTSLLPEFMWPLQQAVINLDGQVWSQIDFDGLFVSLGQRVANI